MNREQAQNSKYQDYPFQGDMDELKKKVRQQWGDLSEDEIAHCEDRREWFLTAVEKKYSIPKEKADKMLRDMERQCHDAA